MNFILHLLIDATVIFGLAYLLPQVEVKSFGTALLVAVLLGVLNFLIGWLIRFPLNLVTFFLLSGVVRLVATALILKLIDKVMSGLLIRGFWPALVIAAAIALAGYLIDSKQAPSQEVERLPGYETYLPEVRLAPLA
ncbi:phage holin family protein [Rhabdobacter roseus]|uniref:Putative membrane protein n=1 Tax=Rhabdobacter roseus TaxID=1655419 RepID=A0A840TNQ6_9BACT|nr:phage holin family protein [Rhabdobacter roseus]MBB5284565.1 putative membrane protein [Rhabdobacter roseus]